VRGGSRRVVRHTTLAALFVSGTLLLYFVASDGPPVQRLSISTAYIGLAFLAATLLISPLNQRRRQPTPVSTNLRRDIGVWAAIGGILHTVVGLQVHMRGEIVRYFVPDSGWRGVPRGTVAFLCANYTGLAATLILALLLAISNDVALRTLGTARWKRIQRWNYYLFALVAVHGMLYLALDKASWFLIAPFVLVVALVAVSRVPGLFVR
jgi:sulfoxide reductase heme-binding subunit YedZ